MAGRLTTYVSSRRAVDASGTGVGARMTWVLGGANAFDRAYFQVGELPVAARYRVTVWDYDVLQS